jgi:hypothetical protein
MFAFVLFSGAVNFGSLCFFIQSSRFLRYIICNYKLMYRLCKMVKGMTMPELFSFVFSCVQGSGVYVFM